MSVFRRGIIFPAYHNVLGEKCTSSYNRQDGVPEQC